MTAYEKMCKISFWVAIPFIRITERSSKKYVRVVGLLLSLVFFPTALIAMPLLLATVIVGIFEDL